MDVKLGAEIERSHTHVKLGVARRGTELEKSRDQLSADNQVSFVFIDLSGV